jgi:hypothetical protein
LKHQLLNLRLLLFQNLRLLRQNLNMWSLPNLLRNLRRQYPNLFQYLLNLNQYQVNLFLSNHLSIRRQFRFQNR